MAILFLILIVVTSLIIGFLILVQNPKGGGLSGAIAGFNNQFMGVKQTTDVLEKGTWVMAVVIALLCLLSPIFTSSGGGVSNSHEPNLRPSQTQSAPAPVVPQQPLPQSPSPATK